MKGLSLWAPVVIYMALIFVASSRPDVPLPTHVSDKLAHAAAYAVLSLLVLRAVAGGLPLVVTRRTAIATLLITIGYGASDEVHQSFVGGRTSELADVYADGAGALVALIGCWAWGIIAARRDV